MMATDWRERLLAAIKADGRSDRAISLAAGLGENFVSQLRNSETDPSTKRVLALAAVLNVSINQLFLGREDITPQDEELLNLLKTRSPEEQAALLTLWRGRHPSQG